MCAVFGTAMEKVHAQQKLPPTTNLASKQGRLNNEGVTVCRNHAYYRPYESTIPVP
jgi:hypothetical protein